MVSDFRRFYGLDLPIDGWDGADDLARPAMLWASLPRESRCVRRLVPAARWGDAEYLLRDVEHGVRVLAWMRTRDGEKGRGFPKPLPDPAAMAENERRRDAALAARSDIDEILGIAE